MLRILLSAYACEPNRGSEPGVGWNVVVSLAEHHDLCVLTQRKNREAIERELAERPLPNVRFVYFDLPAIRSWLRREFVGRNLYYNAWQLGVYGLARQLHREQPFDLVHHVTFVKYSAPNLMGFLPCPSLWGPVGGGESIPRHLLRTLDARGRVFELGRNLARWINRLDPISLAGARAHTLALATSEETAAAMRELGTPNVRVQSAIALSEAQISELARLPAPPPSPLRFVSIGRLLSWKGFHLGLAAFAKADIPGATYWIVGDGPERQRLEGLAHDLGIGDRVRFFGRLAGPATLAKLAESHVLVHPSLHESGGLVCLEAMAASKPVLCLDLGGPALHVSPEAGCIVETGTPERIVERLSGAMRRATDDRWRTDAGAAGRKHVRKHVWSVRALEYSRYYVEVLALERPQERARV